MDKKIDKSTGLTKKSEVITGNFIDSYESIKKSLEKFFKEGQVTDKMALQIIMELRDTSKELLKNFDDL